LLAAPSFAASSASEAALSGDVLTWSLAGDNEGAILRISGQGVIVEQTFARGAAPTQSAFDNDGNALPDGTYTWELRAHAAPMAGTDQTAIRRSQEGQPVQRNDNYSGEVISGAFTILNGAIVDPGLAEAVGVSEASSNESGIQSTTEGAITNVTLADQVILDDLIVDGSICVGFDCVNGEAFGFDTIRLKENNLRIKFEDTSTGAFPSRDWQLTANDSANGGQNKFSIDDIDGGRTPFTIEAGAPSNSLYVDDAGRVGLGTSTPVLELHVVNGDSPALRLEQNGSSGFTAQTWDIAGNETNFFVRDVTHGSLLPFRIKPSAPTNSLYVDTDGDVGLSTASPSASLHVKRTDGTAKLFVEETLAQPSDLLELTANGNPRMVWRDTAADLFWRLSSEDAATSFVITRSGTGEREFVLDSDGNLEIRGTITTSVASPLTLPDYVFSSDYSLMPLDELQSYIKENGKLPRLPSGQEVYEQGLDLTQMQIHLLEKVEELTLYTLEQQNLITELQARLSAIETAEN
jgi:hypothetical protein